MKVGGKTYKVGRISLQTMVRLEEARKAMSKTYYYEKDKTGKKKKKMKSQTQRIDEYVQLVYIILSQDNEDFDKKVLMSLSMDTLGVLVSWAQNTAETEQGFLEQGHGEAKEKKDQDISE